MNNKKIGLSIGGLGTLAVILGAFGAHSLKEILLPEQLITYKTGISYHFYHIMAMTGIYFYSLNNNSKWVERAFLCFALGIILFSGSLYLLATREVLGITSYKWLGPLTPIGGVFFVLGWIFTGISIYKAER